MYSQARETSPSLQQDTSRPKFYNFHFFPFLGLKHGIPHIPIATPYQLLEPQYCIDK